MGKYPIYAILAIVFIGIIKLLQVTAFDSEQYAKNKELSFSQSSEKKEVPYKKEKKTESKPVKEKQKPTETGVNTPQETQQQTEEVDSFKSETATNESEATRENKAEERTEAVSYQGFEDLKQLYLAPIISDLPSGQLREDVVIRYYKHEQDNDKVYSLRKLGYYIHEKEALETAGLGSNVMYYGSDVNVEDIQIVAYELLKSGLPLKSIQPTQFSWKSNSIEIGTDTLLIDNTNLTESAILNFEK